MLFDIVLGYVWWVVLCVVMIDDMSSWVMFGFMVIFYDLNYVLLFGWFFVV